jgi:hypothetical protein
MRARAYKMTLKEGYKETATEREVSVMNVGKSLTPDQFGELLDNFCNSFGVGAHTGMQVGRYLQGSHRTLQRSVVVFLLGILKGIQEDVNMDYGVDPRNEQAIKTARKIAELIDAGELDCGMMI